MPRRLPPLNALRAFEAAARHSSFTKAANELNVSHSAISRHVRGLEDRLGVHLFRKVPGGLALTDIGRQYLDAIAPAFEQIAEATEAILPYEDGIVTLSCEPTFALKWLVPRLGEFQDEHPGIDIQLDASSMLADIENHEFDMSIRYSVRPIRNLQFDLLYREAVYPVGRPALKKGVERYFEPAELTKFRLLREQGTDMWRRWFTAAGVPEPAMPRASGPLNTTLAIEAAIAGQGLALVDDVLVAAELAGGKLVKFSEVGLMLGGYFLVYRAETAKRAPVRAFRQWLLSHFPEDNDPAIPAGDPPS